MGGYVAPETVAQPPERIERRALVDTSSRPHTWESTGARLRLIVLAERGRFHAVTDALLALIRHRSRLPDAGFAATIRDAARREGEDAFVRQEQAIMSRAGSRPGLAAIRCPTFVPSGREDPITRLGGHEERAGGAPVREATRARHVRTHVHGRVSPSGERRIAETARGRVSPEPAAARAAPNGRGRAAT